MQADEDILRKKKVYTKNEMKKNENESENENGSNRKQLLGHVARSFTTACPRFVQLTVRAPTYGSSFW